MGDLFKQVYMNHKEKRIEWKQEELEDNLYSIYAALTKNLEIVFVGEPYLLEDGETWARNYKPRQ